MIQSVVISEFAFMVDVIKQNDKRCWEFYHRWRVSHKNKRRSGRVSQQKQSRPIRGRYL
jgi:hypothetical protein